MKHIINPEFSAINLQRNNEVFNMPEPELLYRALCVCEEAGELAGVIKKLHRGFNAREFEKTKPKFEAWITNSEMWSKERQNSEYFNANGETKFALVEKYWRNDMYHKIKSEWADTVIYLDLLASIIGFNSTLAIQDTFNKVSDQMNAPTFKIDNL